MLWTRIDLHEYPSRILTSNLLWQSAQWNQMTGMQMVTRLTRWSWSSEGISWSCSQRRRSCYQQAEWTDDSWSKEQQTILFLKVTWRRCTFLLANASNWGGRDVEHHRCTESSKIKLFHLRLQTYDKLYYMGSSSSAYPSKWMWREVCQIESRIRRRWSERRM